MQHESITCVNMIHVNNNLILLTIFSWRIQCCNNNFATVLPFGNTLTILYTEIKGILPFVYGFGLINNYTIKRLDWIWSIKVLAAYTCWHFNESVSLKCCLVTRNEHLKTVYIHLYCNWNCQYYHSVMLQPLHLFVVIIITPISHPLSYRGLQHHNLYTLHICWGLRRVS